eukprot:2005742-Pyramimonas_sp.AAC.1
MPTYGLPVPALSFNDEDIMPFGVDGKGHQARRCEPEGSRCGPQPRPKVWPRVLQPKEKKEEKGTRTLTLTDKFICRPGDLFDVYTNQNRIMGFTQSPATFEPTVGGKFSMFDGSVV